MKSKQPEKHKTITEIRETHKRNAPRTAREKEMGKTLGAWQWPQKMKKIRRIESSSAVTAREEILAGGRSSHGHYE